MTITELTNKDLQSHVELLNKLTGTKQITKNGRLAVVRNSVMSNMAGRFVATFFTDTGDDYGTS